ncbi:MAG TPA: sugar phosphate nucleotidyltransferase [Planctomycetota bacterium]
MKGVVLAGGRATRLLPLTKFTNKHLLPVGREPMLYHALHKLRGAGIEKILVITGTDHMGDVVRQLGSGKQFGCSLSYRVQEKPTGTAAALRLAEDFVGADRFVVLLGDNIFEDALGPMLRAWLQSGKGARVHLKPVPDPGRYGVATLRDDRLEELEEKPERPTSNLAVSGIYFYDAWAFQAAADLRPSGRDEFEITDLNRAYLDRGELDHGILEGWWTDAGTFESLHLANSLVRMRPARF